VDSAYALYLTARAKDKLHIRDVDVDSLQVAVDYLETLPLADEEKALMHYYTGINYYRKDSLRRSVQEYYKCLDYQTDTCTRIGRKTYENLGDCFFAGSLFKEALEYYKISALIATALNDSLGMCIMDEDVAFTYCVLDQYDSALVYSNRSIQITTARNDSLDLAVDYNTRSVILDELGHFEEALEYNNKAFSTYPKAETIQLSFYITRCDICLHLNMWDSVDVCLRKWQECKENRKTLYYLYNRVYLKSKQDSLNAFQILYADSAMYYQELERKETEVLNQELLKVYDTYQAKRIHHTQLQTAPTPYVIGVLVVFFMGAGLYFYIRSSKNKVQETKTDILVLNESTLQQNVQIMESDDLSMLLQQAKTKLFSHPDFIDLRSQNNYSASAIPKEDLKKMNAAILASFSQVNVMLRKKYPSLSDANQFYCILLYLGYKTHIICALMECSENAIYQRKHRVTSQLEQKDAQIFFC
jgi:tetratricopeptide (TPR) repeat protein